LERSQSGTWKAGGIQITKHGLKGESEASPTVAPSSSSSEEAQKSEEDFLNNKSKTLTPGNTPGSDVSDTSSPFSSIVSTPNSGDSTKSSSKRTRINYDDLHISRKSLGSGASASVVRACLKVDKKKKEKQQFALKIIDLYEENVKAKQIISEVKALYDSASCENVVKFYEAFHREGSIRLLIEYMDCGSLEDIYKTTGTIPENVLAEMTFQMLRALQYLEEKKIIHRDIKPANILVNKQGVTKLTDFGMSQQLNATNNRFKTFQGTYYYMSPERLKGADHSFDSDIWSLGVSIAECAIGCLPFEKGSEASLWNLLQYVTDCKISIKKGDVSDEFLDFIHKCMEIEPEKRPSAAQLFDHPYIKKYIQDPTNFVPSRTKEWLKKVYLPAKKRKEKEAEEDESNTVSNILKNYEK